MAVPGKDFVFKHVFKNVSMMKKGNSYFSTAKKHYGVSWRIVVRRNMNHFGFYFRCEQTLRGNWSIDTQQNMKMIPANGATHSLTTKKVFERKNDSRHYGRSQFIEWDKMMKNYVKDDAVRVEIHVKINKMTGIKEEKAVKMKLQNFDDSMNQFSDIVLIVNDQKFHVSKSFLAHQSPYFKSLLFENPDESKKSEITLTEIEANDFQNFLEILHGEPAIDDNTINGILHLASKYDTKTVIRQCEEFMMGKSEKSAKEKLELAVKYNLDGLKNKCLMGIKTRDDIRSVLADNVTKMDHSVLADLLQKAVSYKIRY